MCKQYGYEYKIYYLDYSDKESMDKLNGITKCDRWRVVEVLPFDGIIKKVVCLLLERSLFE